MPDTGEHAVTPVLRRVTQLHTGHRGTYNNPNIQEWNLKALFSLSQI